MTTLRAAAEMYAREQPWHGDHRLAHVFAQHALVMQRTIRSVTPNQNHWDDALNEAHLRIWRVVKSGKLPDMPEEALIVQLTRWAAIGVLRRQIKHEALSYDALRDATVPGVDAEIPEAPAPLLLDEDPGIWHDLADLWTAGWDQRGMALKLGVAPPTIRREIAEMRKACEQRREAA